MEHAFLLGNPRSGTSLLRLMLGAHPEILAPPECGFAQWWLAKYGGWNGSEGNDQIVHYVDDVLTSRKIETWNLDRDEILERILKEKPNRYGKLVDCIYLSYRDASESSSLIVDKNNYYINHLSELDSIWPESKFIFLVRDGRDVACSYLELNKLKTASKYKPQLPGTLEDIANEWSRNNERIIAFLETSASGRFIVLRYEDLVANPDTELTRLCSFLNIDFSSRMLVYYLHKDREPSETLDWKRRTLTSIDVTRVGRYKIELTATQVQRFNELAGKTLRRFGY